MVCFPIEVVGIMLWSVFLGGDLLRVGVLSFWVLLNDQCHAGFRV